MGRIGLPDGLAGGIMVLEAHLDIRQARIAQAALERPAQRSGRLLRLYECDESGRRAETVGEQPHEPERSVQAGVRLEHHQSRRGGRQDVPATQVDPHFTAERRRVGWKNGIQQQPFLTERQRGRDLPCSRQMRQPHANASQGPCEGLLGDEPATNGGHGTLGSLFAEDYLLRADQHLDTIAFVVGNTRGKRQADFAKAGRALLRPARQYRAAAQERRHGKGSRLCIEGFGRTHLQQPPALEHSDAVGQLEGFLLVVRYENGRDAELPLDLFKAAAELGANLYVESPERFVQQQHFGLVGQGPGNCDPLQLASRQLSRESFPKARQADQVQKLLVPAAPLGSGNPPDLEPELDVLGHGHVPEDRVVLEDEAHVALLGRKPRDIPAVEQDASVVRRKEAGCDPQDRALAAAAGPQEHKQLALQYLERHPVYDDLPAEMFGDLFESDRHTSSSDG